ncbi:MAG: hypothetical protein AB1631_34100 [Acidobacteriota bacterium]
MKCIKCQTDNKLKDRAATGGRCMKCRHPFTFDPKVASSGTVALFDKATAGANFTDVFFANVIAKTSVNNTLFFTPRQLYYMLESRRLTTTKKVQGCGCLLTVISIVSIIVFFSTRSAIFLFGFFALLAAGIALMRESVAKRLIRSRPKEAKTTVDQFKGWITAWEKNNGPVEKLLPPPQAKKEKVKIDDDIKAYSFDRVVVCERATTAQFLIANNFHFEHNCAVLSGDHYPQNIFDTVMEMLRRNPSLKVYALHNASAAGVQLAYHLSHDAAWFKDWPGVEVFDIGLMPRQVMGKRMFVEQSEGSGRFAKQNLAAGVRLRLKPEELNWLEEGHYVDVESIPPQGLLRMVAQGIALSRAPGMQDALADPTASDYDGGTFVFISDSFG